MSTVYPITHNINFSYTVNNQSTTVTKPTSDPYYITVTSPNDINLILTPSVQSNIKWTNIMTYNLQIQNPTSSPISNFAVKLNSPQNLSYISGTLVNSQTGQYYPLRDWQNEFDVLDTIPANGSLNVKYSMQINPNVGPSVISPVTFSNSGSFGSSTSLANSNNSFINISEPRIVYDNINYTLQNTGTIPYSFTYKFTIPTGKTYTGALLDSNVFNNLTYTKLGSYAIFNIKSLPPQTSSAPNLLQIVFQ